MLVRKPAGDATINWRHPSARDLRFFAPLSEAPAELGAVVGGISFRDYVSGVRLSAPAAGVGLVTVGLIPSRTGHGLSFTGAANSVLQFLLGPAPLRGGYAFLTMAAKFRTTTGAGGVFFSKSSGGTSDYSLGMAASGLLQFTVGTSPTTATSVKAYNDGAWYTFFGFNNRRGMGIEVYDDAGHLVETVTFNPGLAPGNTDTRTDIYIGATGSGTNNVAADIEWAGVWYRIMGSSERGRIAAEPYELLSPQRRLRAFLGAALAVQPPPPATAIPAIIRRRQSIYPPTKPTNPRLQIDWQNPLTQGLLTCVPFLEGQGAPTDYARNLALAVSGTPVWESARGMLAARARAVTDFWTIGTDGQDFVLPRLRATILAIRTKTDSTLRNAALFGVNDAAADNTAFQVQFGSGGTVVWRFGGTSITSNAGAYRGVQHPEAWAFVTGPTEGMKMYRDGISVGATLPAGVERQEGPGQDCYINRLVNGAAVNGELADYQFFALLDAEWSEGQVRSWTRDPWQFFRPIPARAAQRPFVSLGPPAAYVAGIGYTGTERRRQPKGDGQLNWRHPLTENLLVHITANQRASLRGARDGIRERVTGRPLIQGTAVLDGQPSRTGQSLLFGPNSAAYLTSSEASIPGALDQIPSLLNLGNVPLTLAIKFKGSFAGSGIMVCSGRTSATDLGMFLLPTVNFRASTSQSVSTVGTYGDDKWYTAIGRQNGIGTFPEVYIFDEHGTLLERAIGVTAITSSLPSGGDFTLGTATPAGPGLGANANIEWVGVWKTFMPVSSMAQLAENPYQIFRDLARERWRSILKTVPAGGPGTISPSGIASGEVVPNPNLVRLALYPTGITTREVHGTPHIGDIDPSGIASAEAFGTARLLGGDINPSSIASAEVVSDGVNLLGPPGGGDTLSPSAIATAEVVPSPTLTEVATIRPTGIPSGFDADNPTVRPPVGTIQPFGIASEEGFSEPVASTLGMTGGTTLFTLNNAAPPASGTVTGKKLCSPFLMLLAGMYDTAPNPAQILPDVYGDFSVGGLRGPIPAVLVTQTSPWIFIAAAHAVQSIDNVYVDDVDQASVGGFVTIPAIALGGGPQVAVIAFTTQPTGEVTWRGKGKMDNTGALIEDPILQLEDMLLQRGGYVSTDFDATALAEAKSKSSLAAWKTAFVFRTTDQIQAWITEVLFNVMGFWRVTGRAQLQLSLDPGGSYDSTDLVDSIIASRDVVDGDDGVVFIADRQQLVNRLVANYRYSWQEDKYTEQLADETVEDPLSMNAYGELRKEVTLRGLRDPALLAQWATILFERQAFDTRVEGALVQFQVKGPRLIHATIGDLIAFTWPYGPTREAGHLYINEILRIVQVEQDFTRGGLTAITAVDTGSYVTSGGVRLLTPFSM